MKKTISELIDELTIINIKIYNLVDKIQKKEGTLVDAGKIQDLNGYRSQLKNAINEEFDERQEVKI